MALRNVPEECNQCSLQFMHPSNYQLPSNGTDEGTSVFGSTDGVPSWSAGGHTTILVVTLYTNLQMTLYTTMYPV